MSEDGRKRYGWWLGGTMVLLVAISAGSVYVLTGRGDVVSLQQVFGEPLSAPPVRTSGATSPVQPAVEAVRQGSVRPPAADIAAPAPPEEPEAPKPEPPSPREVARALTGREDYAAALRVYDRLRASTPADTSVLHERAKVLAWAGRPADAAAAMGPLLDRSPSDGALLFEKATYQWWAGRGWAADSTLSAALTADPSLDEARQLRRTVRLSLQPSSATAQAWLEDDSSAPFHLLLARALGREGKPAAALRQYALAQATGAEPDSLHLEIAATALDADSPAVAVAELEVYAADHPAERPVRVRLARAYGWAGETERAIGAYDALLAASPDPDLRYERAALYASTDRWERAVPELRALVAANPKDARSLKLLGDLARWDGKWQEALDWYGRAAAADPKLAGVTEGRAEAEAKLAELAAAADSARRAREAARVPGVTNPLGAVWSVRGEAFGDSEDFRWYEALGRAGWSSGRGLLGVSVYQGQSRGALAAGLTPRITAWGAGAFGRWMMTGDVLLSAEAGFRAFDGMQTVPSFEASLATASTWPDHLALEFSYGPAVRRAASAAALAADVRSGVVSGVAEHYGALWGFAGSLEAERLSSAYGLNYRLAGSVTVQRLLLPGLYGVGTMGVVSTDGAAPLLPAGEPLYWTPQYYVAPQLGLRWEAAPAPSWRTTLRFYPGYAWVHEQGADRRFNRERLPFLSTGLDVIYAPSPWEVGMSLDWSGALVEGYRAAALRLWVSPHVRWP